MTSPLTALASIISSGVQTLESAYAKDGLNFPSLDDPFQPNHLTFDPALMDTTRLIVAAAAQIIATVRFPMETIQNDLMGMYTTALLGFAVEANVPDILKDAGPQGLHAKEIAAHSKVDELKLARILRYLATRHHFKEVTPNVFANNRITSMLIKTKSLKEIKADPVARYDGTVVASLVGSFSDEGLRSSAFLGDWLLNPGNHAAPFNVALQTPLTVWEWYEQPGNEVRSRRFTAAMKGGGDLFPPEIFIHGVGGSSLKEGEVIVDVGGSIGTVTLHLANAFPKLRFVVQDLDKQIDLAKDFWNTKLPEAITTGKVQLQAHDFFKPQPVKGAAVYFMRVVLHDWNDTESKKIMANLRAVANKSSKLVLFELLIPYPCETPGAPKVPFPLLANLGVGGGGFVTGLDIQMLSQFCGQERTVDEFRALGDATGWKLESVVPGPLSTLVFSAA